MFWWEKHKYINRQNTPLEKEGGYLTCHYIFIDRLFFNCDHYCDKIVTCPSQKGGKQHTESQKIHWILPKFHDTCCVLSAEGYEKHGETLKWALGSYFIFFRHRCTTLTTSSCHTYSKVLKKESSRNHPICICVQHLYLANRAWQCPINTYDARAEGPSPTKWSFTNCLRSQQDRTQMFLHNNSWPSFDINTNDIEIKKFQKMFCPLHWIERVLWKKNMGRCRLVTILAIKEMQ